MVSKLSRKVMKVVGLFLRLFLIFCIGMFGGTIGTLFFDVTRRESDKVTIVCGLAAVGFIVFAILLYFVSFAPGAKRAAEIAGQAEANKNDL